MEFQPVYCLLFGLCRFRGPLGLSFERGLFSSGQKAQARGQNQGMLHWTEDRKWRHKKWWNWCQHITVRNWFAKDIVGEAKKAKELEIDGETIPGPEACPWFLKNTPGPAESINILEISSNK